MIVNNCFKDPDDRVEVPADAIHIRISQGGARLLVRHPCPEWDGTCPKRCDGIKEREFEHGTKADLLYFAQKLVQSGVKHIELISEDAPVIPVPVALMGLVVDSLLQIEQLENEAEA